MKKMEKYQGLREKLESMWGVKTTVVIGALGVLIPKLEERLQQTPGTTADVSAQKSIMLGTADTEQDPQGWRLGYNFLNITSASQCGRGQRNANQLWGQDSHVLTHSADLY